MNHDNHDANDFDEEEGPKLFFYAAIESLNKTVQNNDKALFNCIKRLAYMRFVIT